jgi:hypothetical protein
MSRRAQIYWDREKGEWVCDFLGRLVPLGVRDHSIDHNQLYEVAAEKVGPEFKTVNAVMVR